MSHQPSFHGIYLPLITPFTDHGDLDADALAKLAHAGIDDGAAGLVALGTTGEVATLSEDERRTVLSVCAQVVRERGTTLIAGITSNDTRRAISALNELRQWPEISAALVTVPYFTRPSEEGVIAHFTQLAAGSPVPLIIYNIPYRTAQPLSAATLRRLAAIPGVAGFKHATGSIDQDTVDFVSDLPAGCSFLAGDDAFASPLLALGATGGILASAHLRLGDFAAMTDAWQRGDAVTARSIGHTLAPISRALFAEPNPTVIKGVLHALGRIPSAAVRLPLLPASAESVAAAKRRCEA